MLSGILILVIIAAVSLLIYGLRGRRLGDEPRCRKCKYNLTGAISTRCPECGEELCKRSVGWGLRRRHHAVLILAVLLFSAEATILYTTYDRAQWIQYYPLWIILSQANSSDPLIFREIVARNRRGSLSPEQRERIIEAGLESFKTKADPTTLTSLEMAIFIFKAELWLTDDQESRLMEYTGMIAERAALRD